MVVEVFHLYTMFLKKQKCFQNHQFQHKYSLRLILNIQQKATYKLGKHLLKIDYFCMLYQLQLLKQFLNLRLFHLHQKTYLFYYLTQIKRVLGFYHLCFYSFK